MKNNSLILRQSIKQLKDELCQAFYQKANVTSLMHTLVSRIDEGLIHLFKENKLDETNQFCLLAIGSYGRRELLLHSDIDLLVLHAANVDPRYLQSAQNFIKDCWDSGLNISHQLTTVDACSALAMDDLTVISSLLDAYALCGRTGLLEELRYQIHQLHMWPSEQFFFAKIQEQQLRHQKYGETAYNLEPNVKNGAGGLRDLQTLLSIGKRHFNIKKLADGITCGFFTDKEYEELINCQAFLWRVRFALHALTNKAEDRLLFDNQLMLATIFGFSDNEHSLAIEQFMKSYFMIVKRNRELNEMLLQWFAEAIIHHERQHLIPLDAHFQLANDFIETKHAKVFSISPPALLELFLWMAKKPEIKGVRAGTIRLIRQHLYLIDKKFLKDPAVVKIFIALFKDGKDPFYALQHMNRYGVLGHYLDCFGAVTGQMQYDLFHVYTVDQHSLFVLRNLVHFSDPEKCEQFSLASKLITTIHKKEILYLAALFHDIAKGRGGDHSELGAEEAAAFAKRHFLSAEETDLLVWLVRYHLMMSHTAQRQDIYDPKTIINFCNQLPFPHYLDYLYLLTVADICATNQKLWNSWKDSLLKELYQRTSSQLNTQKNNWNEEQLILHQQEKALDLLKIKKISIPDVLKLWQSFKGIYFLHESPEIIALHTEAILNQSLPVLVVILPHHSEGGTEIFIYMPHRDERFAITTTILSNQNATIQEATILTCDNNYDLDTYIILDEQHHPFTDKKRIEILQQELSRCLEKKQRSPSLAKRRVPRTLAHFKIKPQIVFRDNSEDSPLTQLFLVAADRPGLLACLSQAFNKAKIILHSAKIATAGERVEDTFFLSNLAGTALSLAEKEELTQHILKILKQLQ